MAATIHAGAMGVSFTAARRLRILAFLPAIALAPGLLREDIDHLALFVLSLHLGVGQLGEEARHLGLRLLQRHALRDLHLLFTIANKAFCLCHLVISFN